MPVLGAFRDEAAGRGLLTPDAPLDAEAAFSLVREMPWTASTGALPEMTLGAWRGDDAGKHYLLRAVLYELGYRSILLACTHAWSVESAPWARAELRPILDEGPVPDVHTFLRVEHDGDWGSVDATWPLGSRALGLPANERFVPGREMRIACDPEEIYHVPEDTDPEEFRRRLLDAHSDEHGPGARERRRAFRSALELWLSAPRPA